MLIAHIPTGYIVSKTLKKGGNRAYVLCGLLFSIWPDLDLVYYYVFDKAKTFHHTYFTHLPIVMVTAFLITLPLFHMRFLEEMKAFHILFFLNWLMHLILDTYTGGVLWLYPFSSKLFCLISGPEVYKSWVLSFITHWSFAVELAIAGLAVMLFIRQRDFLLTKRRCLERKKRNI